MTHTTHKNTHTTQNTEKPRKIWLCSNASCELSMESAVFTRTWRLKRSASGQGFLGGDGVGVMSCCTRPVVLKNGCCFLIRKVTWKRRGTWKHLQDLKVCVILLEVFLMEKKMTRLHRTASSPRWRPEMVTSHDVMSFFFPITTVQWKMVGNVGSEEVIYH